MNHILKKIKKNLIHYLNNIFIRKKKKKGRIFNGTESEKKTKKITELSYLLQ